MSRAVHRLSTRIVGDPKRRGYYYRYHGSGLTRGWAAICR